MYLYLFYQCADVTPEFSPLVDTETGVTVSLTLPQPSAFISFILDTNVVGDFTLSSSVNIFGWSLFAGNESYSVVVPDFWQVSMSFVTDLNGFGVKWTSLHTYTSLPNPV